jgi:hypothetical protein
MMQRSQQHVFQFFTAELGTMGSTDEKQQLVIRGKYVPKLIQSLPRKYIVSYITCKSCRSPDTELMRDPYTWLNCASATTGTAAGALCPSAAGTTLKPHLQEGSKQCSRMREMVGGRGGGEWLRATISPTLVCHIVGGPLFFGGFMD